MFLDESRWNHLRERVRKCAHTYLGGLLLVIGFLLFSTPASAINIDVDFGTILPAIKSTAPYRLTSTGLQLNVIQSGQIILPFTNVRRLSFDVIADSNFQVQGISLPPDANRTWSPSQLHIQECQLEQGVGQCTYDLRRTPEWGPDNRIILHLIGTGTLTLNNLVVDGLEVNADPRSEHRWAMLWTPERFRHTTINTLTPIYWNPKTQLSWTLVFGLLMAATLLSARTALTLWAPLSQRPLFLMACLFCLLVYQGHWMLRFYPMVHKGLWLSDKEKIERHYSSPEFGLLTAAARETIPVRARVIISVSEGDWFSGQTLAFNLAPRICGFEPEEDGRFSGLFGFGPVSPSEADYFISFRGGMPAPPGFTSVFELNKYTYIAERTRFSGKRLP